VKIRELGADAWRVQATKETSTRLLASGCDRYIFDLVMVSGSISSSYRIGT
jgi:hypothetical protein